MNAKPYNFRHHFSTDIQTQHLFFCVLEQNVCSVHNHQRFLMTKPQEGSLIMTRHCKVLGKHIGLDYSKKSKICWKMMAKIIGLCIYNYLYFWYTIKTAWKYAECFSEKRHFYQKNFCLSSPAFLKYFQPHCAVVSWLGLVVKIMSNTRSEA